MADNKKMDQRPQMLVGTQLRICEFKNIKRVGTIELHLLPEKASKYKEQNIMMRTYEDKDGVTWGIPTRVLPNGEIEWQRINIKGDVVRYNLKNEREAKEAHVVCNSPLIQGSPTAGIDARYKIYNPEAEAMKASDDFDQIIEAGQYIKSLGENQLIAYGRLFGIAPETNSVAVIKQVLLEKVKKDPKAILNKKQKESETGILIVLRRALAVGLLKTIGERGLVYNDQIALGLTENTAIEFLRQHPEILVDMDRESKHKDVHYKDPGEKSADNGKKDDENFD